MRTPHVVALAAALLLASACTPAEEEKAPEAPAEAPETPPPPGPLPAPAGRVFDPAALQPGDTVLGLVVTDVDAAPAEAPLAGYVGEVVFAGELELAGRWAPHPDPELGVTCFWPDATSALRLPRFPEDRRTVWLCFDDPAAAARHLGPPGTTGSARIVVDRYRTVRRFTDDFDTARLLRVLERDVDRAAPGAD